MPSPASGPLRAVRAALVAVTTVALGALAHVAGGGAAPSAQVLAALAALGFAPAVLATRRRLGPVLAVALLGAGQALVHLALGVVGPVACVVPGQAAGPHAGHGVAAASAGLAQLAAGTSAPGGAACAVATVHVALGAHAMLALHVLATVTTGVLLAGGERVLWWAAAWLRPLVAALRPATLPVSPRLVAALPVRLARERVGSRAWSLRGPPAGAPACA
jgi:hypothetical protein